jgi:Glycosyltransferase family 87
VGNLEGFGRVRNHPGRYGRLLLLLLAVGLVLRLIVAFTQPVTGDVIFRVQAVEGLRRWGLGFYSHVNDVGVLLPAHRAYFYPPGFLPWLLLSDILRERFGIPFAAVERIPAVLADVGLAYLVSWYLHRRRAPDWMCLVAAGLILLGPSLFISSALQGELDSVAIVPAVVAVIVWELDSTRRRALVSGLLIGVGASIKSLPILMVLALLPSARSWCERLVLVGSAGGVLLIVLTPFLVVDPSGTIGSLQHGGYPGAGGVQLLLQPGLVWHYLGDYVFRLSAGSRALQVHGWILTVVALGLVTIVLVRNRPPPVVGASLIWLVVYATAVNWQAQYMAWGIPFFLMAGWIWQVAIVDAVLLSVMLITYAGYRGFDPISPMPLSWRGAAYFACVELLWMMAVAGAIVLTRSIEQRRWRETSLIS